MIVPEVPVLQGQDILILTASEWRDNAVSNMHIAAHLSEWNTVAFVETPGGRMPRFNELHRVLGRLCRFFFGALRGTKARGLDPRNVHIFSPLSIPVHGQPIVDRINRRVLLFQIRRYLRRLGIRSPIVWSFSPNWQPVVAELEASVRVFHCVDALHTYDSSPGFRHRFERAVRSADVVFTPGILLYEQLKALNPNTHRVGHGCGEAHLAYVDDGMEVAQLRGVPEPRAVYAGTLANWVDYDLLIETARRLPEVSFVLIGYVHALAPKDRVNELLSLPNVYAVGYQNYERLPAFYHQAKVGIVPYNADNEHIRYSSPTKFLDYLAAGLPIVSTRFPAAEELAEFAVIAETPEEFAAGVSEGLAGIGPREPSTRRDFAHKRSWSAIIGRMAKLIEAPEIERTSDQPTPMSVSEQSASPRADSRRAAKHRQQ